MPLSESAKLSIAFKKLIGHEHRYSSNQWYEECPDQTLIFHKGVIQVNSIPSTPPAASTSAIKVYTDAGDGNITMCSDNTIPLNRGWRANDAGALRNFIHPRFGSGYVVRVYEDDGAGGLGDEIPTSDTVLWTFDYENGYLALENQPTVWTLPLHIEAYKYTGSFLSSYMEFTALASNPDTPPANTVRLFAKESSSVTKLLYIDSAGTVTQLGAGGGGGNAIYIDESATAHLDTTGAAAHLNFSNEHFNVTVNGTCATVTNIGAATFSASGAVVFGSTLNVSGATSISNTLWVCGSSTLNGVTNSGSITTSTLNVTANASVQGTFHASGATTFGSTLSVSGQATFSNNVIVSGTLTVSGAATVSGAVLINNTLGVSGAVTFHSTLAVSGAITSSSLNTRGNICANGTVLISSTLTVGGNTILSGTLTVTGASTLQVVNVRGVFCAATTVHVCGAVTFGSTLNVSGQATFNNNVVISGNITPGTDSTYSVGSDTNRFATIYTDLIYIGTAGTTTKFESTAIGTISVAGNIVCTADTGYDLGAANFRFSAVYTEKISFNLNTSISGSSAGTLAIFGNMHPRSHLTYNLGGAGCAWSSLYVDALYASAVTICGVATYGSYIDIKETAAPASPGANTGRLYVKDYGGTTTRLYYKDELGTETDLIAAGGGGNAIYIQESATAKIDTTGGAGYLNFSNEHFNVGVSGQCATVTVIGAATFTASSSIEAAGGLTIGGQTVLCAEMSCKSYSSFGNGGVLNNRFGMNLDHTIVRGTENVAYGLRANIIISDTTNRSSEATGIGGYCIPTTTNCECAVLTGLSFGVYGQGNPCGHTAMTTYGVRTWCARGVTGETRVNHAYGIWIKSIINDFNWQLSCTYTYSLYLADGNAPTAGSPTAGCSFFIEKPTRATLNYQMMLEGNGAGTGIWLNATSILTAQASTVRMYAGAASQLNVDLNASTMLTLTTTYIAYCAMATTASSVNPIYWDNTSHRFHLNSSSKRYKENIKDYKCKWDDVLKTQPKIFTGINGTKYNLGYIAEEIDELGLDYLVNYNTEGQPESLNYQLFTIYAIEVIKDQSKKIEKLENEVTQMAQRIDKILEEK